MLTAANYSANLKTAAKNAAAALGLTGIAPSDFTLEQRQAYNQALVKQILAYPNSFSPEEVNQAATMNTDYGLRGYYFDSALGTALSSVADTVTKINPLDASNIKTVGMWLLIAGVVLGAFYLFLKTPPRGGSPSPARA
jgi:hypothetical protein